MVHRHSFASPACNPIALENPDPSIAGTPTIAPITLATARGGRRSILSRFPSNRRRRGTVSGNGTEDHSDRRHSRRSRESRGGRSMASRFARTIEVVRVPVRRGRGLAARTCPAETAGGLAPKGPPPPGRRNRIQLWVRLAIRYSRILEYSLRWSIVLGGGARRSPSLGSVARGRDTNWHNQRMTPAAHEWGVGSRYDPPTNNPTRQSCHPPDAPTQTAARDPAKIASLRSPANRPIPRRAATPGPSRLGCPGRDRPGRRPIIARRRVAQVCPETPARRPRPGAVARRTRRRSSRDANRRGPKPSPATGRLPRHRRRGRLASAPQPRPGPGDRPAVPPHSRAGTGRRHRDRPAEPVRTHTGRAADSAGIGRSGVNGGWIRTRFVHAPRKGNAPPSRRPELIRPIQPPRSTSQNACSVALGMPGGMHG